MIIIDSREKKFEHIENYFKANDIPYEVKKLETGDYFNTENPSVTIDRKSNLQEICSNLSKGQENYSRFVRECKRAFVSKMHFIVLIESEECSCTEDLKEWQSKFSKHTGRWLVNEMFRLTMAYNVDWRFCRKSETAERILEILNDKRGN